MRILVTGATGMLGTCIVEAWQGKYEVFATGRKNFEGNPATNFFEKDLKDDSYEDILNWADPEIIVHCAALTHVDYCEDHPRETFNINSESVSKLHPGKSNSRMLFISSDAVFKDGLPMATESMNADAESIYGQSKRDAEKTLFQVPGEHLSIRTTIVGKNLNPTKQGFAEWIIQSLRNETEITLFEDAIFTPITIWHLAQELEYLFDSSIKGILHISGTDAISKYEFAMKLCEGLSLDASLVKKGSIRNINFKAKRSLDQTLSSDYYQSLTDRELPTMDQTTSRIVQAFH
jgi:dTDP-4-dehydrorhamnose reductase